MFVEIQTRRSLPNFTMFKVVFVIMLALSSVARSRADSFFEETRSWDNDAPVCSVDSPDDNRAVNSKSRCSIE